MKWEALLNLIGNEPVFHSSLLLAGKASVSQTRVQLPRWVATGRRLQIRRGLYAPAPYWRKVVPHPSYVLAVKVEVYTSPPAGGVTTATLVRKHVTLNLCHHNLSSLLAGKLHALLSRLLIKGRDLHELIWRLSGRAWPEPSSAMLNNALARTQWPGPPMESANRRQELLRHPAAVDWAAARADLRPFLARVQGP
jgi:hypothetical protein